MHVDERTKLAVLATKEMTSRQLEVGGLRSTLRTAKSFLGYLVFYKTDERGPLVRRVIKEYLAGQTSLSGPRMKYYQLRMMRGMFHLPWDVDFIAPEVPVAGGLQG